MDTFENDQAQEAGAVPAQSQTEQPAVSPDPEPGRPGFYQPLPLDGSMPAGGQPVPRPFPQPQVPWSYGYPQQGYVPPQQGYIPPQPHQMPPYPPHRPAVPRGAVPPMPAAAPAPQPAPDTAASVAAPKKKERKVLKTICACGVVVGLVTAGCGITAAVFNNKLKAEIRAVRQNYEENEAVLRDEIAAMKPGADGDSNSGTPNTSPDGLTPGQVYARNVDSVVAINCTAESSYGQLASSGSGFCWTEDGYIVSNYHVVEGADSITVITNDGTEHTATFVGGDASNDIALLKIEAEGLQAVTIGSSSELIVGDQVAAVGNALGELASTLTVGYVSAMDRIVTTEGSQINMIQTDAAINAGNSGGPLFNMKGEVIGITTAKYSGTASSGASIEGIGFAIPMDDVIGMLEDLREYGYVTGGYLGVTVSDMDSADALKYGLPMGVLVHDVTAGSCADKGGIQAQDILVELGGYTIENLNDLTRALREFDGGDQVTAVVYRASEGGEVILTLTLDTKPVDAAQDLTPSVTPSVPDNGTTEEWFDHFFGN